MVQQNALYAFPYAYIINYPIGIGTNIIISYYYDTFL